MLFRNIDRKLPALFLASLSFVSATPVDHKLEPRCQDYDPSLSLHAESLPPDGDQVVPLSVPFLEPKGHQGDLVKSIKGELASEFAPTTSRVLQKAAYNDYWDGVPLDPELSASGSAYDSSWFDNTGGVGRVCIDPSGKRARSGTVNIRLPGQEPDSSRYPHRLSVRGLTQLPGPGEAAEHLERLKASIEYGMPLPSDSDHNPVSYMDHLVSISPKRKPTSRRPRTRYPSESRPAPPAPQYNPGFENAHLSHAGAPSAKTLQPPREKSAFKRPQIRYPPPPPSALEPAGGAPQNTPDTQHGMPPPSGVERTVQRPKAKSPYRRPPRVRYPQDEAAEGPAAFEDEVVVSVNTDIPISATVTIPDADVPTAPAVAETVVVTITEAPPLTATATVTGPTVAGPEATEVVHGGESVGSMGLAPTAISATVGVPSVTTAPAVVVMEDDAGDVLDDAEA